MKIEIGNKVKFSPEAINIISEPELIDLDMIYEVRMLTPRIVIDDMYGHGQRIPKRFVHLLTVISDNEQQ